MLQLFSSSHGARSRNSSKHASVTTQESGHETIQGQHDSLRFSQGQMTAASGTIAYMAPELLTSEALRGDVSSVKYSQSVDVYAMGCIMWESLNLDRVWGQYNFSSQVI